MPLLGVDLPVDIPIWDLTVEASWSANMSSKNRNVTSPFLTTRYHYWWGIDLPVDWSIWALKVEMSYHHSSPLDGTTAGGRSATWSANMSSKTRNVISPFLTIRCHYWGVDLAVDLPIWALTVEARWSANMSCNNGNLKLLFLAIRCLYWE